MTAQNSAVMKTIAGGWLGKPEHVQLTWDVEVDGGEADDTVRLAKIDEKILVTSAHVYVETSCTGESGTMIIGIEGGDTDAFMDITSGAVANLVAGYVVREAAGQELLIDGSSASKYIGVDIATTDFTTGKVHLFLTYIKVP